MAAGYTMGIVIGAFDRGGEEYWSVGMARRGSATALDEHTVFEIGSVTKVFTATLLALMAEKGEVRLDQPVGELLPASVRVPARNGAVIRLVDLATHTSGLPRLPSNLDPADVENPYADYSVADLYRFLGDYRLAREIGARYEYSNLGAGLLGHALALRAGEDYEGLVLKRIAAPLGMSSTRIRLGPEVERRRAQGHQGDIEVPAWDLPALAGAGALRSTAADLVRFLKANLGILAAPPELAAALRATHAPRVPTGSQGSSVALGWHVLERAGRRVVWHNGQTGGFHSFAGFDPQASRGAVVLTNSSYDVDDLGFALLDAGEVRSVRRPATVGRDVLKEYVGRYAIPPSFVVTISLDAGGLALQVAGQPKLRLYAESEESFFVTVADARLTFVRDSTGAVTRLRLRQGGAEVAAPRVP